MRYVLEDLLQVREFRRYSAENEVIGRKRRLEEAVRAVRDKEQALRDYIDWRIEREAGLFEEIRNKLVVPAALENLKQHFFLLREKELVFEKAVMEAEKARKEAVEELEKARDAYNTAVRRKQKIEEHKTRWMDAFKKEQEREQEKEMEDFRVLKSLAQGDTDDDEDE